MKEKIGEDKVFNQRSWDLRPDELNKNSPYIIKYWIYNEVPKQNIPDTESLKILMKEL